MFRYQIYRVSHSNCKVLHLICENKNKSEIIFYNIFDNNFIIFDNSVIIFDNIMIIFDNIMIIFDNLMILFDNIMLIFENTVDSA